MAESTTVDGVKHGIYWLLSCRLCGPLGLADSVGAAQNAARAHIASHSETQPAAAPEETP